MPSTSRPVVNGTVSDTPVSALLICAGMSSAPSSRCAR